MNPSRTARRLVGALLAAGLFAAGCDSDNQSVPTTPNSTVLTGATGAGAAGIGYDDLRTAAAGACPLPVDSALAAAGLTAAGGSTGAVTSGDGAVRTIEGIAVECTVPTSSGSLSLLLVAGTADKPASAGAVLLLPQLQHDLEVSSAELTKIGDAAAGVTPGSLVPLDTDKAVALAVVVPDGARTGGMEVRSSDGVSRDQVKSFTTTLATALS